MWKLPRYYYYYSYYGIELSFFLSLFSSCAYMQCVFHPQCQVGGRLVRALELGTLLFSFVIIITSIQKAFPITVFFKREAWMNKYTGGKRVCFVRVVLVEAKEWCQPFLGLGFKILHATIEMPKHTTQVSSHFGCTHN